jgi:hypothetical protein
MSKITNRDTAPGGGTSADDRLARLLDAPYLARVVPHLPAETLHQLIRHRGLEACGELLTSATPAQLTSLLDLDLWRHARPGRDERFDVERFGEWLEVLVDTGTSVAARTVAALDPNIVVAGLSRYVRVLDPGIFEPTAQSDDEAIERHEAMREGDSIQIDDDAPVHEPEDDSLECEVGGYIVRARRTDAWDAIVSLLVTLDAEQGASFQAVMQGCRNLSHSRPEIDGLDDLLQAPEQQLHDVTIERERRRSQQGYATPADARAFLQMAREPKGTRSAHSGSRELNPIVVAYFRAADEVPEAPNHAAQHQERGARFLPPSAAPHSSEVHADATGTPGSLEAVLELLAEAGMMPQRPRALLEAADGDPRAARLAHLRRLMTYVRDTDDDAYVARGRELAFLANTLVAGCSVQSRAFTPQEASDAAASICNLGLEYWPARWPGVTSRDTSAPDALLIDHDLVTAFEVGWSVLHHDVTLFVADGLISILDDVDCVDREIRRGLAALRRTLVREREAGAPWRARDAAEILATLDATAWISVLGLLDECPVRPAALTAVLEARTTSVSPTAFEFISTAAEVGDVRIFMRKLPALLTGR